MCYKDVLCLAPTNEQYGGHYWTIMSIISQEVHPYLKYNLLECFLVMLQYSN